MESCRKVWKVASCACYQKHEGVGDLAYDTVGIPMSGQSEEQYFSEEPELDHGRKKQLREFDDHSAIASDEPTSCGIDYNKKYQEVPNGFVFPRF